MSRSFIYTNIHIYRLVLNLIYAGRYRRRFQDVVAGFPSSTRRVTELCFGDIQIAEYCRGQGITWVGYDLNERFVAFARERGFDARRADLLAIDGFEPADVCVIVGSLYHFHDRLATLLEKMLRAAPCLIISEPVRNFSSLRGPLGFLARRLANAGRGREEFRYGEVSLLEDLDRLRGPLRAGREVLSRKRDLVVRIEAEREPSDA